MCNKKQQMLLGIKEKNSSRIEKQPLNLSADGCTLSIALIPDVAYLILNSK